MRTVIETMKSVGGWDMECLYDFMMLNAPNYLANHTESSKLDFQRVERIKGTAHHKNENYLLTFILFHGTQKEKF